MSYFLSYSESDAKCPALSLALDQQIAAPVNPRPLAREQRDGRGGAVDQHRAGGLSTRRRLDDLGPRPVRGHAVGEPPMSMQMSYRAIVPSRPLPAAW